MRSFSKSVGTIIYCLLLCSNVLFAEEYGSISVYSAKFTGSKTANGESFTHTSKTAAHKTLPFGTMIRITRLDNNQSVVVRVNDRGPYVNNRIADISLAAGELIGLTYEQQVKVKLEVIGDAATMPTSYSNTKKAGNQTNSSGAPPAVADLSDRGLSSKGGEVPREYSQKPAPDLSKKTPKASSGSGSDGLYKIQLQRPNKKGYAIQVASVAGKENMLRKVSDLQSDSYRNVLIHEGSNDSYKILLGSFDTHSTAESYLKDLKKKNISGFVVNLSDF
jgi:rare lipoprotein A